MHNLCNKCSMQHLKDTVREEGEAVAVRNFKENKAELCLRIPFIKCPKQKSFKYATCKLHKVLVVSARNIII